MTHKNVNNGGCPRFVQTLQKSLPTSSQSSKQAPRRRRRFATQNTYRPNQKWGVQIYALALFFLFLWVVFEEKNLITTISQISVFVLITGMFYAIFRTNYFIISGQTLIFRDFLHDREVDVAEISIIRGASAGSFGAVVIVWPEGEFQVKQSIYDKETIDNLIVELRKINPAIVVEK